VISFLLSIFLSMFISMHTISKGDILSGLDFIPIQESEQSSKVLLDVPIDLEASAKHFKKL
jgi:hypothetical protein